MSAGDPGMSGAARPSPVPGRLHFAPEPQWPRRLRRIVAALILLVILVAGAALPLVLLPETQPVPGDTDAVVVLAGGQGERLATAERLMPRGAADLLVLSVVLDDDRDVAAEVQARCDADADDYRIECVEPLPVTTRGEARTFADVAAGEGWDELTVLTSTYHVTRARILFERCVDAEIEMVGATPQDLSVIDWVRISLRELVGLTRDGLIQRGC